jgi:GT2 family glycosyltransferase
MTQTWTLGIATFRRQDMLMRCLRLAMTQTRLPEEVVVVDASPDWQASRERALHEVAPLAPGIPWRYVQAERPSSAVQRNQCVRLATSDVVFLIDDDSLMYRECAERIMEVYDADRRSGVAGVAAVVVPDPPDTAESADTPHVDAARVAVSRGRLERMIRKLLDADDIFVPYDEKYPDLPLPDEVRMLHVGSRRHMAGMSMTVRRGLALREPFETAFERVSAGEDSDMSYRLSRHGALATALDARVCHVGSPGGRLSPFPVAALGALNPLVAHRLHSTDLKRSRRSSRRLLRRRLLIELFKDVRSRRASLPRARGIALALRYVDQILDHDAETLRDWYRQFQVELIQHGS